MSSSVNTIFLATDHAGFAHKEEIRSWLEAQNYTVVDYGASEYDEEDDFTDFICLASEAVNRSPEGSKAIIFGGSGQGEAMLANSYPNVRAVVYYGGDLEIIRLSREHNNANILSIGARFVSVEEAKIAITTWLETPSSTEEKYQRRNQKIKTITDNIVKL